MLHESDVDACNFCFKVDSGILPIQLLCLFRYLQLLPFLLCRRVSFVLILAC